jgi:coenzyme F420-0:L-glutamate ligase / coenzyme F420-1:gamma-L-glutamate ligase
MTVAADGITIHPLTGIGEVGCGDDLAALLAAALTVIAPAPKVTDVLVITSKIVSKAEGRHVSLSDVVAGAEALRLAALTGKDPRLVELILSESCAIVRAVPGVLITRHRLGFVMANSGIDQSNIGPGPDDRVLLLPQDPDATAGALHIALEQECGSAPAILISDSFGRPWREGVVNVAIGAAGLPAIVDRRGELDRSGRALEVTEVALADLIASAAGLAMGEGAEGVPAALVRGLAWRAQSAPAKALIRPAVRDLFA